MSAPEIVLERFLQEKKRHGERRYAHILGRLPVEELPSLHYYRVLVTWMNRQLSDIGVNSTGGVALPPLHFDLVRVQGKVATAHVFRVEELAFIVITEPMVNEMLALAEKFVRQNIHLFNLYIAPEGSTIGIAHFIVFLQFSFITSHEYSHLVRHSEDAQSPTAEVSEALIQAQEVDADGYGIYHILTHIFNGGGRAIAATWLNVSNPKALDNSLLDCFLYSLMIQLCARWAGRIQVDSDLTAEHPPPPLRIEYALLHTEMWCREVRGMDTTWMTAKGFRDYFDGAAKLFSDDQKKAWRAMLQWLASAESEEYRSRIRSAVDKLRKTPIGKVGFS